MNPIVSVIIPAYQASNTLPRAVQSVLAQDFSDFEIIIIDDVSNDDTWKIIKELEKIDTRIMGIRLEKKLGPAGARNTGVSVAKGSFLAFLDADDEWMPDKLGKQVEFLVNNPSVDVVFTDATNINATTDVRQKLSEINGEFLVHLTLKVVSDYSDFFILEGSYRQEMYRKFFILISSVLMRRTGFERIKGFARNRFGTEDVDFFVRLSSKATFAYWYCEKVYRYQSDGGISWVGEKRLVELADYHRTCLKSAKYEDLREIALHNLLKIYRYLIVFYALSREPMKAIGVFRESLSLGFYPRLAVYSFLSFAGPIPFRVGRWYTALRLSR